MNDEEQIIVDDWFDRAKAWLDKHPNTVDVYGECDTAFDDTFAPVAAEIGYRFEGDARTGWHEGWADWRFEHEDTPHDDPCGPTPCDDTELDARESKQMKLMQLDLDVLGSITEVMAEGHGGDQIDRMIAIMQKGVIAKAKLKHGDDIDGVAITDGFGSYAYRVGSFWFHPDLITVLDKISTDSVYTLDVIDLEYYTWELLKAAYGRWVMSKVEEAILDQLDPQRVLEYEWSFSQK